MMNACNMLETRSNDLENEFQFQLFKNSCLGGTGQRAGSQKIVICITRQISGAEPLPVPGVRVISRSASANDARGTSRPGSRNAGRASSRKFGPEQGETGTQSCCSFRGWRTFPVRSPSPVANAVESRSAVTYSRLRRPRRAESITLRRIGLGDVSYQLRWRLSSIVNCTGKMYGTVK